MITLKRLLLAGVLVSSLIVGYFVTNSQTTPKLGATSLQPQDVALFSTTLVSGILPTDTSMTLASASYNNGASTLASSTYMFVIGGVELVLADCTGTVCTNMTRGLDWSNATSSVTALKGTWRRGDTVKITTGSLVIYSNIFNGKQDISNLMHYNQAFTYTYGNRELVTFDKARDYANALVAAGVATSSETNFGGVWLGTALQQASSTDGGANKPYVSQTKYATDTPLSGCAVGYTGVAGAGCNVIATLTGKIRQTWLDLTAAWTFTGPVTFNTATTTFNATTTVTNGLALGATDFGGRGTDGALTLTSGTTTINLANVKVLVKDYTSISITGSGHLAFSNPNTTGTVIILRSQGNVVLTCSPAPCIEASGLGAVGGASAVDDGTGIAGLTGTAGTAFILPSNLGTGAAAAAIGTGGAITSTVKFANQTVSEITQRYPDMFVGAGGGSGNSFDNTAGGAVSTSGAGGNGGGALIIEARGSWNFTTANGIMLNGVNGGNGTVGNGGTAYAGGGGGGASGYFLGLYNQLIANSGTVSIAGGTGGAGASTGAGVPYGGGAGGNPVAAGASGSSGTGGAGASGYSMIEKDIYQ